MTIRRADDCLARRSTEPLLKRIQQCRNQNSPCNSIFSATCAARIPAANCAANDAGKRAIVMGWVHRRRDLGKVIFIHLRDRDGVTQVVFNEGV